MLLSPAASDKIHALFGKFGAQGEQLFHAFMNAVRLSLSTAISDLFLLAAGVGVIALVVVLFLREDPLRQTHHIDPESGEEDSELEYEPEFDRAGAGVGLTEKEASDLTFKSRVRVRPCRAWAQPPAARRAGRLRSRQAKPASRASSIGSPSA